jgi:O-antigen/teichoic acid export membrane protein
LVISKINKNDILWGYLSQFLYIGSGAILIPVAIANLSAEEMGLWYVFFALAGLAQLLEFGLQPTVSRLSSYVYSGADSITAQGVPEHNSGHLNENLLIDFIYASKVVYRYVASGALFVLFVLGTSYLYSLGVSDKNIYLAWFIFSVSSVIGFYFSYFNGLLQGRGQQTEVNKVLAQSKLLLILIAIPLILCGFGLLSLSISTLISVIYNRYLMYKVFYAQEREETSFLLNGGNTEDLSKLLILSSWRLGIAHLGTFLIFKVNLFIASSFFGLKVAASYGLSLQLINLISSVSCIYFNLNIPRINSLQATQNKKSIYKVFYKSLAISVIGFVVDGTIFYRQAYN